MSAGLAFKTALALVLVLGLGWLTVVAREKSRTRAYLTGLRGELQTLRVSADSCRGALANEEADFRDFDRQVDSLRLEVRGFEELDPRGVPGESYDAYMEHFEDYNRAVPDWRARADTLAAHWEACRAVIQGHNALADSLQNALLERGGQSRESPQQDTAGSPTRPGEDPPPT